MSNRSSIRKIVIFFSSVLIFILHIPISFAKSFSPVFSGSAGSSGTAGVKYSGWAASARNLYDSLNLDFLGLSMQAFENALQGMERLLSEGIIHNDHVLSIVDFSLPSTQKRLFILDLCDRRLAFNTYVAHGQRSGETFACEFSNKPSSYKSSLGFYETSDTYYGKHGYSLKLSGLEQGINDLAGKRAIVIHGAPYVSETLIQKQGFLGRSLGCPAIPEHLHRPIIETIKNGTCLYIHAENEQYESRSPVLNN